MGYFPRYEGKEGRRLEEHQLLMLTSNVTIPNSKSFFFNVLRRSISRFYKTVEYNQKRFETLKTQDKHPEIFCVPPELPPTSFQYPSDEIIEIWKSQELRARLEFSQSYLQRQRILQELHDADPGFLTSEMFLWSMSKLKKQWILDE